MKTKMNAYNSYAHHYRGCLSMGTGAMPVDYFDGGTANYSYPFFGVMLLNDFYPGNTSEYFPARLKPSSLSSSPVVNDYSPARLKLSSLSSSPVVNAARLRFSGLSPSPVVNAARLRFSGLSSSPVVSDFNFGCTSKYFFPTRFVNLGCTYRYSLAKRRLSSLSSSGFVLGCGRTYDQGSTPWYSPAKRRLSGRFSLSSNSRWARCSSIPFTVTGGFYIMFHKEAGRASPG